MSFGRIACFMDSNIDPSILVIRLIFDIWKNYFVEWECFADDDSDVDRFLIYGSSIFPEYL